MDPYRAPFDKKTLGQLTALTTLATTVAFVATVTLKLYQRVAEQIAAQETEDFED